jgi:hypothetical protein
VVCKRLIGINHTHCSHYETIHEVFSSPMLAGYEDILPHKSYVLYLIARAFKTHERTALKALENGTISRATSEAEAKELLASARDEAGLISAPFAIFPDEDPPTRPMPRNWRKYKSDGSLNFSETSDPDYRPPPAPVASEEAPSAAESSAGALVVVKAEKAEEGPPLFQDHPVYGTLIKDAGANTMSAICHMVIYNDIQIYGGAIPEEVRHQILNARVNHPEFFERISRWDHEFQVIPVTVILRDLGYR